MSRPQASQVIDAARAVAAKGLSWGTAGNISIRVDHGTFLISPSGSALSELLPQTLVECSIADGGGEGTMRPSIEAKMHAAVYRARPDARAILHASPFYATLVASSGLEVAHAATVDTAYYLRAVRRVPFHPPGSVELAEEAALAASGCDVLVLENHGALSLGSSPPEAVTKMEVLEIACRMTVAGSVGVPLRPLSDAQVGALLAAVDPYGQA